MLKQERTTFKWGDQEYLLDDLLKLHSEQENHYYDFARNKGQYDETALKGLREAITNRINAVKSGQEFSADGVLDTDKVDNTSIQTQKKGLFKKAKYVDQDNTEWARYYINKLVGQLKPYTKSDGSWNLDKYGLGAYLTGQGLKAQDIFENYDLKDENNPEAERVTTQRRSLLKQHLTGYRDWLQKKGFDFTKNDNEWDDSFQSDFAKFIEDYDNLDENQIASSLRKFGAGDDYTMAFTSNKWDLSKSSDQLAKEEKLNAQQKKEKEEKEKYQQYIKDIYGTFKSLDDNNLGGTFFTSSGDGFFDMSDSEYEAWLNTHTNDKDAYMRNLQERYYKNPFDTKIAGEYLPLAGRFGALKDVNINGKVYKYDPRTIDRNKNRFVAFDPESGEIKHAFIGDIESEKEALRRKWRIANGYEDEASQYFKEGGIISMQTGGGFNLAQSVNRDLEERNKNRAKQTGNTEEVQKARDRIVSNGDDSFTSEKSSIASPDAGFTGAEIARLVSIGADITSMFLDPVTGTAVGLGSSLLNFGADIADDGWQWSDLGNLGVNVGLDLLGAIPLFGDAVGTGTKITRQLLKWAPRAMAGLAAYQGVSNFDGMMNSWGKLTSGDSDQKLTVQDWRNIAQSIGLLTGATRAIKNKAAQNNMKKQAKVDGVVGVSVRDKKTGEIKQLLLDGDTAKNIRNHKGDKTKIENELSQLEDFKGKFGNADDGFEVVTKGGSFQKPFGRTENADGSKSWELRGFRSEGRADVRDIYDFSRVQPGPNSIGYQIPGVSQWLNNKHQALIKKLNPGLDTSNHLGAMTSKQIDDEIAKLRSGEKGVDAEINRLKQSMEARTKTQKRIKGQLVPERKKLQELQKKLNGVSDEATLNRQKTDFETDLQKTEADIQSKEALLKSAQDELDKLLKKKRIPKKNKKQHQADIKRARGRVAGHQAVLNGYNYTKTKLTDNLNTVNGHLQTWSEFTPTQNRVKQLNDINSNISSRIHTNAYKRLQTLLNDLQTNHSNIGGRQINWDMQEILTQAGIQNAFKSGGSINRNKINKFLNYGKR